MADLAHCERIERGAERRRNLCGDDDAAASESEHDRFGGRPFLEFSRQEPARFDSIAEQLAAE